MPKTSTILVDIGEGLSLMLGIPTLASWKTSERPEDAKNGTFGFNSQSKSLEYWDGKSWWEAPLSQS